MLTEDRNSSDKQRRYDEKKLGHSFFCLSDQYRPNCVWLPLCSPALRGIPLPRDDDGGICIWDGIGVFEFQINPIGGSSNQRTPKPNNDSVSELFIFEHIHPPGMAGYSWWSGDWFLLSCRVPFFPSHFPFVCRRCSDKTATLLPATSHKWAQNAPAQPHGGGAPSLYPKIDNTRDWEMELLTVKVDLESMHRRTDDSLSMVLSYSLSFE